MKKFILRLRLKRELSGQNNTGKTLCAVTCDSDAGEGGTDRGKPKEDGRRKERAARENAGKTGNRFAGKVFCIVRSLNAQQGKSRGLVDYGMRKDGFKPHRMCALKNFSGRRACVKAGTLAFVYRHSAMVL